ncbi:BTB POZ domain protein [Aspergillus sclerotialis]|uniref:BTB POZ domain protein n=1 Tax=Aspergillus sclerotialis TaxID=2070753 RepID=A0A3A2ZRH6_9EURO|nr:BTB POZ domain protein [Aspergillus sclerotialis]
MYFGTRFSDLREVMKNLLTNGKYSDLTISCEGTDFKVHRAVICSQSTFFDAAVNSGFREAASSRIDLPEDDVDTITRVLTYCYLQHYPVGNEPDTSSFPLPLLYTEPTTGPSSVTIAQSHLRVYIAADKFNIPNLKELARCQLVHWAYENWSSASFPSIVQDIWCNTPLHDNDLRDRITGIVAENIQHFLAHADGKSVLINNAESAVAVLKLVADREAQLKAAMPAKRRKSTLSSSAGTKAQSPGS